MRWLALLLLCVNILVWYLGDVFQPPVRSDETSAGTLPRVVSLKQEDSPPQTVSESDANDGESSRMSESTPGSQSRAEPEPQPEPKPQAKPVQLSCARIGWIDSRERAEALLESVASSSSADRRVLEVERELPPLNWVLIPPQPHDRALRQFRDIQRQGIDSYLVTEGEYRNAISLGLFESYDAAISVLEEKKRQNLNAVLAKYDRNQISYALDFEAEPDLIEGLVQAVTAELGEKIDFIEINPCEGVATPEKNP